MKVLYISHAHENSGYGYACRQLMKAMDVVGIDVVSRPVLLNNSSYEDDFLTKLKAKSDKGCDTVIQHVLPHFFAYNGNYKNIGYVFLDTSNISYSPWMDHINLMDEIWTPFKIDVQHKKIHLPCDITEYKDYPPLPDLGVGFKFYFIGEFIRRKNIGTLLRAFHTEFSPEEPVNLVLKCNKMGFGEMDLFNEIKNFCNKVKEGMRLHKNVDDYKSELVITEHIHREGILRLHSGCDCYINPSYGESWSHPTFDAMAMGNRVISTQGGPKEYLQHYELGHLIDAEEEPVFGMIDSVSEIGTGRETWSSISTQKLMKAMRHAYENPKRSEQGRLLAQHYSYENIGSLIRETLT